MENFIIENASGRKTPGVEPEKQIVSGDFEVVMAYNTGSYGANYRVAVRKTVIFKNYSGRKNDLVHIAKKLLAEKTRWKALGGGYNTITAFGWDWEEIKQLNSDNND